MKYPKKDFESQPIIAIAAAGTGGHVFPGLAVANLLIKKECDIAWIGADGPEKKWVESNYIAFYGVSFSGVRGKGIMRLLKVPFELYKAIQASKKILKTLDVKVVLAMGGYITLPVGIAAKMLGIPLIIHEQNAVAGLSNKLLHKIAQDTLVAFEGALSPSTYTGNPVRFFSSSIEKINRKYETDSTNPRKLKLLILGGSLGAQALNEVVPDALSLIPREKQPIIVHQSGKKHLESLQKKYDMLNIKVNAVDFIDKMDEAYAWADLVICRAGAMTIAELATIGVPAILVPYPHAVDDHQTKNTQLLVNSKAAWHIPQSKLTPELLAQIISNVNLDELRKMALRAHLHSQENATELISDVCLKYIEF